MSLSGNDRAQAQYNATPNLSKLSASEKSQLLTALQNIWSTDTTYITANAVVQPNTLNVASLPTAGSPSAQTITPPGLVSGTGTIG